MRIVIQRVKEASVTISGELHASVGHGMLILVGVEDRDSEEDVDWLVKKVSQLRIFDDSDGVMNCSVVDVGGEALVVSQFTLHASTKKGNRPSYIKAAKPDVAIPLYEKFLTILEANCSKKPGRGIFGADMKVDLVNDGPVTIIIDSKLKF